MTSRPEHFISCDWGTTNFRLRLVETETLRIIAEHQTDQGIRNLNEQYTRLSGIERVSFFAGYLNGQIRHLPTKENSSMVVVSGMASSNIGMQELPYADLPFHHSGRGLNFSGIIQNGLSILLISGVKSDNGMMRGEEMQAIGLEPHLRAYRQGILILPGTHSKHIDYQQGRFLRLKNFMTGELFEILSRYSILSKSLAESSFGRGEEQAFREGLGIGFTGGLTSSLFSIRALDLLKGYSRQLNYYRLSGMLIGDELCYLKGSKANVFLAAPDSVFELYRTALEEIIPHDQLVLLNQKALEEALLKGQKKILMIYEKG